MIFTRKKTIVHAGDSYWKRKDVVSMSMGSLQVANIDNGVRLVATYTANLYTRAVHWILPSVCFCYRSRPPYLVSDRLGAAFLRRRLVVSHCLTRSSFYLDLMGHTDLSSTPKTVCPERPDATSSFANKCRIYIRNKFKLSLYSKYAVGKSHRLVMLVLFPRATGTGQHLQSTMTCAFGEEGAL
jgi:hypothetical protein